MCVYISSITTNHCKQPAVKLRASRLEKVRSDKVSLPAYLKTLFNDAYTMMNGLFICLGMDGSGVWAFLLVVSHRRQ